MNNQEGNASFIAIVALLIISLSFGLIIKKDLAHIIEQKRTYQGLLCAKELNSSTGKLIRQINLTNKALMLLKSGKLITSLIPKLKLITGFLGKAGEKSLKTYQIFKIQNYRKNLISLNKKSCHVFPTALRSPYKMQVAKASRDKWDRLKQRSSKKWQIKAFGGNLKIESKMNMKTGRSQTKMTRSFLK